MNDFNDWFDGLNVEGGKLDVEKMLAKNDTERAAIDAGRLVKRGKELLARMKRVWPDEEARP